jgi:hypothetical protein
MTGDEVADPSDLPASSSGGRTVEVPLRRLDRWVDGFAARHGASRLAAAVDPGGWLLEGADGATARLEAPGWLGLVDTAASGVGDERPVRADPDRADPDRADPDRADPARALSLLAGIRPTYGVILIRRAGYAVGCFRGWDPVGRKVGRRHIHGRTAAGGWSQQRYARRRDNQADEIVTAAATAADRILVGSGPEPVRPSFLVTGGDRPLVAAVLQGVGRAVAELPVGAHVGIGTPDAAILAGIPDRVLVVRIHLFGPGAGSQRSGG